MLNSPIVSGLMEGIRLGHERGNAHIAICDVQRTFAAIGLGLAFLNAVACSRRNYW